MQAEPVIKFGGVLKIKVVSGKLTHNTETFTKMDPFVEIKFNNVVKRTSVQLEAGKNPIWNETLEFEVLEVDDYIDITVLDQEYSRNDLIGSTQFIVKNMITTDSDLLQTFDIMFAGKPAGNINFKADWQPFSEGTQKAKQKAKPSVEEKFYERWFEEKVRKLAETEALINNLD
jgi:Ca2+-dependent lipid-binding protein